MHLNWIIFKVSRTRELLHSPVSPEPNVWTMPVVEPRSQPQYVIFLDCIPGHRQTLCKNDVFAGLKCLHNSVQTPPRGGKVASQMTVGS